MERMRRSATKEKDFIARELTADRDDQFQCIEILFAIISINIFLINSRTLVNTKSIKTSFMSQIVYFSIPKYLTLRNVKRKVLV